MLVNEATLEDVFVLLRIWSSNIEKLSDELCIGLES